MNSGVKRLSMIAAAVMLAPLPPDSFRLFAATADPGSDLPRRHQNWIDNTQPTLGLIHADPRCPDVVQAAVDTASASGAFLVGGLVSHRCETPLIAGGTERGALGRNGISGMLLSPEVSVATALTQGCTPIGPVRRIDEARDNVVMAIDGKPALNVFLDDVGPDLARDPRRLGGLIFAGLPVQGSDTGDYLVRNLMAIDPRQGWIVLGAEVSPGDAIVFCRRDPDSAKADRAQPKDGDGVVPQRPGERGMHRIPERLLEGRDFRREPWSVSPAVFCRQEHIARERPVAVHPKDLHVLAEVIETAPALAAGVVDHMRLGGDEGAGLQHVHPGTDRHHMPGDFVTEDPGRMDVATRPVVPVEDVHVGPADRGGRDLDQDVLTFRLRDGHLVEFGARSRSGLDHCRHRRHGFILAAAKPYPEGRNSGRRESCEPTS